MMGNVYQGEPLNIIHTAGFDVVYPVVRCQIDFADRLDRGRLVTALNTVAKVVPEILCRYDMATNSFEQVMTDAALLIQPNVANPDQAAQSWDLEQEPQLRVYWLNENKQTKLIFYISHIFADGAGSKALLYLIGQAYAKGPAAIAKVSNDQNINWLEELVANYQPQQKGSDHPAQPLNLPALADQTAKTARVGVVTLNQQTTMKLVAATHQANVTVNDVIMSAFGRVMSLFAGINEISLACPTDMRQFGPQQPDNTVQIANLTSRYNFTVATTPDEDFNEIVADVHQQMTLNKANRQCFDSIKDLLAQFATVPLAQLQQTIAANYHMRPIAYTNFGIIDQAKLGFTPATIKQVVLTGGFRTAPAFQICAGTYAGQLSLAFNMTGNEADYHCGLALTENVATLLTNFALANEH